MSGERELKPQEEELHAKLGELRELFGEHLREHDRLKKPEGIATGYAPLDQFLFWGGIPKGALSLFCGSLGMGATSLWIEAATHTLTQGRWAAWIDRDVPLAPLSLYQKGMDLGRLVSIERPDCDKKLFWLLQELMSSSLFELIGCDLGADRLKEHQLRKLQAQAREAHVALVFLSQGKPLKGSVASVFSLIVGFEKRRIQVERALHRPTPHGFVRSVSYGYFTKHTKDRIGSSANKNSSDDPKPEPGPLLTTRS